ncbi:sugar transferase [Candidatus Parcubacteria bacterium]|nr:sugar transferase [Candidatus Parcubacteria bacterium]
MRNNAELVYRLVLVVGDFLALAGAFTAAYILRVKYDERPLIEQIPVETYLYAIVVVLPLWILIHGAIGLYSKSVYEKRFSELGKLVLGSVIGILTVIGYDFVVQGELFPARLVPVYGFLLGFGFLVVFRNMARISRRVLYSFNVGITNLVIVGSDRSTKEIINQFSRTEKTGYRIIGVVGENNLSPDIPTFSSIGELSEKIGAGSIDSIIQTKLYSNDEKNGEILNFAQQNHIEYRFIPGRSDIYAGKIEVELFREIPVITVHQTALFGWGQVVKRVSDIVFGVILLAVFSPLILLAVILLKISEPGGKILFRQTRLTQYNKAFTAYKFRSHKTKYSGSTPEEAFKAMGKPELARHYRQNGDHLDHDPRISAVGKFLRLTSLDEIPQLFNVIKGDISLVGPRALIPEELDKYYQKHHILSIKSGLTGLAQVSGRRNISFDERRKLDVYYVQNWSFWLDLVILLKTLRAVIGGSGAK